MQVLSSILLISMPSIPIFFIILGIGKVQRSSSSKKYIIPEKLMHYMISFSFGTLIGDVLLHILPTLYS